MKVSAAVLALAAVGALATGCGSDDAATPATVIVTVPATTSYNNQPYKNLDMTPDSLTSLVQVFRSRFPAFSVGRSDNSIILAFQNTCVALAPPTLPGMTPAKAVPAMFTDFKADKVQPSIGETDGIAAMAVTRVCPNYRP